MPLEFGNAVMLGWDLYSPEVQLAAMAELGFTRAMITPVAPDVRCSGAKIRRVCESFAVAPVYMHSRFGGFDLSDPRSALTLRTRERIARDLDLTAELGASVLILHPVGEAGCLTPPAKRLTLIRASLERVASRAIKNGVRLDLENMPGAAFSRPAEMEALLDACAGLPVGFCFDAGHAHIYGLENAFLERFGKRITSVHLHDNRPDFEGGGDQHFPPYEGNIDWERFIPALLQARYRDVLMFEEGRIWEPGADNAWVQRIRLIAAGFPGG